MKKIIILSNLTKFPYHTQIIKALNTIVLSDMFSAQIMDISGNTPISTLSQQLSATIPDTIITLDLAGFELKTLTGECLLNMLPCKVLNIIWGAKPEYSDYLSRKLSLSMLFYDATGEDNVLSSKYPDMRYYYPTNHAIPTAITNNNDQQITETLQKIWTHFKSEVLL